jgi:hypothetical protein
VGHGEGGALASQQGRTETGIANQRDTSARPLLDTNLAHGVESGDHSRGDVVAHVRALIAVSVAGRRKRCNAIAEISLKLRFRAESDIPDRRMQSIRRNHEIKAAGWAGLERDLDSIVLLADGLNAISEQDCTLS